MQLHCPANLARAGLSTLFRNVLVSTQDLDADARQLIDSCVFAFASYSALTPSLQRVCRYIGIQEKEFEWLTEQLVSVANKYCKGRIVSALEGGYRIQGGIVSAFARSVASHVRALSAPSQAKWSWADVQAEQQRERQRKVLMLCSCKLHVCWSDMQTWPWLCAQA